MWALRCLVLLLCGAALGPAVHLDFAEHRSQAAKIKVNPRGNLWATGHFMGKKSVTGSPHLEPPEEPAVPTAFGPSLRALLEEMVELLTRELLRVLWRERLLDENQGKYDLTDQAEQPQLSQPVLTPTAPCPPYAEESRTGRRTPGPVILQDCRTKLGGSFLGGTWWWFRSSLPCLTGAAQMIPAAPRESISLEPFQVLQPANEQPTCGTTAASVPFLCPSWSPTHPRGVRRPPAVSCAWDCRKPSSRVAIVRWDVSDPGVAIH
ncbi:neuromedin-B isoform X2 [Cuculus canorus]|uniref:neuromedin-B isoform X2 n=1 Tax=Cuculus canorus TaxID=55661 RepID=UPI0023AA70D5|nr:neuromedin-B isoform X2 [Cuculus canorus]